MVAALPLAATDPLVVAIVAGLLGGGLLSGAAVLIRAPKQGQLDVMSASKVIYDELRAELVAERREKEALQTRIEACELERDTSRGRLAQSEAENQFLRERVTYVEDQIRRRQSAALGGDVLPRPDADRKPG